MRHHIYNICPFWTKFSVNIRNRIYFYNCVFIDCLNQNYWQDKGMKLASTPPIIRKLNFDRFKNEWCLSASHHIKVHRLNLYPVFFCEKQLTPSGWKILLILRQKERVKNRSKKFFSPFFFQYISRITIHWSFYEEIERFHPSEDNLS